MKKPLILHPFLLSIYPVVFLYGHNIQEMEASQILIPILIAFLSSVAIYIIAKLFTKNSYKAALITAIIVIIFFSYGYIFDGLAALNLFTVKHRYIWPITIIILGYLIYFTTKIKSEKKLQASAKILNIIAITLIIINIATIVPAEIKKYQISKGLDETIYNKQTAQINTNDKYPDIYYIILDGYASFETIKTVWGYDNDEFKRFLEKKKFFVVENSKVGFADTVYSMASTLNMNRLPYKNIEEVGKKKAEIFKKYTDNIAMAYLKKAGYKIEVLNPMEKFGWPKLEWKNADPIKIETSTDNFSVYNSILLHQSLLKIFEYKIENKVNIFADVVKFTINELKKPKNTKDKIFIYAHITSPHPPFVFNQKGQINSVYRLQNFRDKTNYLNQYIYITKEAKKLIDILIERQNSVIIIQSDHGPRHGSSIDNIPDMEEKKILLALYLPNLEKKDINKSLPPEDIFKIIFNNYFNEDFKLSQN